MLESGGAAPSRTPWHSPWTRSCNRLDAISSTSEQERAANAWPLEADAWAAMIADEAEAIRPDLRTAGVDRVMMWQILAELRTAFEENAGSPEIVRARP